MLQAVDLSNHTGPVTASDLGGVALVIAKCTELGPDFEFTDPTYGKWRAMAKSIGARFMAYHFAHPATSAAESWSFFAEHAQLLPGDLYACDLEVSDGLGADKVAQWGSAFAHCGYGQFRAWPWAYSDRAFIAAGNLDGMTMCPLWVAMPTGTLPPATAPVVPPFPLTIADQWKWGPPPLKIGYDAVYADRAGLAMYAIPDLRQQERIAAREVARFGGPRLAWVARLLGRLSNG